MNDKLTKQHPIETFVKARDRVKEKVLQIERLFKEIDLITKNLMDTSFKSDINNGYQEWDRCKKAIDFRFWYELLKRGMITNVMTDVSRNKYIDDLRDHTPEFSIENVSGLAQNIEHIYKDNAKQMVKEVYEKLIGCHYGSWHQKKQDNLNGVKKAFRCSGNINYDAYFDRLRYDEFGKYGLNFGDLLRVCYLLDGKNMGTYAERFSVFADEVFNRGEDTIETDYFSIKCYHNGNQYVKWKEGKDYIRERLNQIGGGNGLPDSMSKRYKKEHFNCQL